MQSFELCVKSDIVMMIQSSVNPTLNQILPRIFYQQFAYEIQRVLRYGHERLIVEVVLADGHVGHGLYIGAAHKRRQSGEAANLHIGKYHRRVIESQSINHGEKPPSHE